MAPVRKRSPIWRYFGISGERSKFAVCLLCDVQISRGGEGKKAGTTAMKNHLRTKHPDEFQALGNEAVTVVSAASLAIPGTSLSSEPMINLTVQQPLENTSLWDSSDEAKKYHYLITEMIAIDNEPISIVERPGFTRLLEQVFPHYKIPSRTHISQNIIPDIYERIFAKIKRNLAGADAISVTSHLWMCRRNDANFLSITVHWVSFDFKLEHAVLAIKPFSGTHTGDKIASELNFTADRWDIDRSKIHLLVHDSDANIVKGVEVAGYYSAKCFLHTLQRAINEALITQAELATAIATSRGLVSHFNKSDLAQKRLLAIQKELNLPQHQLVQDTNTRWNSTYYMIERLLEQKRAISLFVADHDITNLTPEQWCSIEQYIKLLKPFEEITKITSSGLSCISEVIPHVAALKRYLDKDETEQRTHDLPHVRASLKAELENRFGILSQDYNYLIATFLDPRFKSSYLRVVDAERARQKIQLEYRKMPCNVSSISGESLPTPAKIRKDKAGSAMSIEAQDTFWDCYNEVANENSYDESQDQDRNGIACEIDYYLKTMRIDRNCDPHSWWSANAAQYPNLIRFSRIYLSAPCSSVYREKLFSEPGLSYENKRNRLFSLNAEKLVFIHHNLPLVHYEY